MKGFMGFVRGRGAGSGKILSGGREKSAGVFILGGCPWLGTFYLKKALASWYWNCI
jgi:hypothetical protein